MGSNWIFFIRSGFGGVVHFHTLCFHFLQCSSSDCCGPARFYDIGSLVTWDVLSCLHWKTAPLFMGTHLVSPGIRGPQIERHRWGKRPGLVRGAFYLMLPQWLVNGQ
jgi:hypothetical protein